MCYHMVAFPSVKDSLLVPQCSTGTDGHLFSNIVHPMVNLISGPIGSKRTTQFFSNNNSVCRGTFDKVSGSAIE